MALVLRLDDSYHPERLAKLYAEADGVEFAEPNQLSTLGPRHTVTAEPPIYVLAIGSLYAATFRVEGASVVRTSVESTLDFPLLVSTVIGADREVLDGEFDESFPSGDGVPGGTFEMRFRWGATRSFTRGDVDANGIVDISDAIALLNFLFLGASAPDCARSADVNGTDEFELTDAVHLLLFLFRGGDRPSAPFPSCGVGTSGGSLDCDAFPPCA